MRDLPAGPALLALARTVLTEELLPLLPRERQLDGRLVAAAMAIAEREAVAGDGPSQQIAAALEHFYGPAKAAASLRRLADDLRRGAVDEEDQRGRAARAILWRLTIAELRAANPRFLAANGFSESPP
jgi:Domain of unknown function (DUF6285)